MKSDSNLFTNFCAKNPERVPTFIILKLISWDFNEYVALKMVLIN